MAVLKLFLAVVFFTPVVLFAGMLAVYAVAVLFEWLTRRCVIRDPYEEGGDCGKR